MTSLATALSGSPYAGYGYSYPHKSAYRALARPIDLAEAWEDEARDSLFLYVHVPFCEVRCGFCNLFATTSRDDADTTRFLDAVARQARDVADALPDARFARFAVGGGTPSYLAPNELERLFSIVRDRFGMDPADTPCSFELAPFNSDDERLAVLRAHGIQRASIGIQTFDDAESRALGRPQAARLAREALDRLREHGFPTLNLDLIYGAEGQTRSSFLATVDAALRFEPEEIYLYPLYVRELTGLAGRAHRPDDDHRVALYRAGRDRLLERGYTQVSMRMFRAGHAPETGGPQYCCQRDGMVGLGAGARSYTRRLHYSSEYAVGRRGVRSILDAFAERRDYRTAEHGFELDGDEQRRRWIAQSVLLCEGLERADYAARFGCDVLDDLPELGELVDHGLAHLTSDRLRLSPEGIERSDALAPWLVSDRVRGLMGDAARR